MSQRNEQGLPFAAESPDAMAAMKAVEWTRVEPPAPGEADDLPYVTHSGVLNIPGLPPLRVHQLNTGQAIIDMTDAENLFHWMGVTPPARLT